jgi:hypothetical protein
MVATPNIHGIHNVNTTEVFYAFTFWHVVYLFQLLVTNVPICDLACKCLGVELTRARKACMPYKLSDPNPRVQNMMRDIALDAPQ